MRETLVVPSLDPGAALRNSVLLLEACDALSAATTVADIIRTVRDLPVADLDATSLEVIDARTHTDLIAGEVIAARRARFCADRTEIVATWPAFAGELADLDWQAVVCAPLMSGGAVAGVLRIVWDRPRSFRVQQRAVITALAVYIGRAFERSLLMEARTASADTLQRAMLSPLPDNCRLPIAARYLPADVREKVGGDWYDAIAAGDQLTVVIGDVVGHDMAAAARMVQLRSMLRAYLVDRREPPSVLLRRLDAANHALGSPTIATAVLAVISAGADGSYRLKWSNAGHPPPILIHTDGTVVPLTGNDVLLGARRFAPRHTYAHRLPPGSTLLLHTDGLVERAGQDIDEGLRHLYRRLRRCGEADLEDLLTCARGPSRVPTDDIAMLAVRIPSP